MQVCFTWSLPVLINIQYVSSWYGWSQMWLIQIHQKSFSSCPQGKCRWRKASSPGGGQVCEDPKCEGEYFVKTPPGLYLLLSLCLCVSLCVWPVELGVVCGVYLSQQQDVCGFGSTFSCLMSLLFIIWVELTHTHTWIERPFLWRTPKQTATQLKHTSDRCKRLSYFK